MPPDWAISPRAQHTAQGETRALGSPGSGGRPREAVPRPPAATAVRRSPPRSATGEKHKWRLELSVSF